MRYQERIYIQNNNSAVRNKDILNVNMSSDMCIFEAPLFNLSGATKIDCTGTTASYVISGATTIPLTFQFTGNTDSFTANTVTFKYEVYKYDSVAQAFPIPAVYKSDLISYSAISATTSTTQSIPVSDLSLDGDYLVKGYYTFNACTEFMNKLGKTIDTLTYRGGSEYGLYDKNLDYYFIAIKEAETPQLASNGSNTPAANQLFQQVILPGADQDTLIITNLYAGNFVLTLNGLVLSPNYDYSYTGNVITLNQKTVSDDIVTVLYTTSGGNNLVGDNIVIETAISSGTTNNQGENTAYFNTTTGKYELFTNISPSSNGSVIVMLNGVTLASGIDYYQSKTNAKRLILEGDLLVGDVITLVYYPKTDAVNGLITSNPVIVWTISASPQAVNGLFTLEVSTGSTFSSLFATGSTPYVVGQTIYSSTFEATGNIGTKLYYRIKNEKSYETLCGDVLTTTAYSETIPLTIQSNSINSY